MTSVKAQVTQGIVDTIVSEVRNESNEMNTQFTERLQSQLDEYTQEKKKTFDSKLNLIKDKVSKERSKIESELRFENNRKLRNERSLLLDELKESLTKDILEFINTKEYASYLNQIIQTLKERVNAHDLIVKVRAEDHKLITEDVTVESIELPMGGIICEYQNLVFDYSLKTRFDTAIETFIKNSNVGIVEVSK
ncbi:hypothetical protein G7059_07330 [Erysipelothrix sp. HDW6A]|uniref:V-type ATP synthase subunit E family protein n=1 Tax=Erysipelothrix sp. HDW6A TaxID=2714928 RepID=UPI00140C891B|nr:V-type ATP synthase subunit E family protein [Erysipelothrix sp. HDW6A]QIK57668.1 hypothetical protein G7059_07330 [Erysipelothrix sp. HDW6A]